MALIRLKPASVPHQFNVISETSAQLKKLRDEVRSAGGELDIDLEVSSFLDKFILKARKELASLRGDQIKSIQTEFAPVEPNQPDGLTHQTYGTTIGAL